MSPVSSRVRLSRLSHEDRDVLGRVAGRVQDLERDVAEANHLAVAGLVERELQIGARSGDDAGAACGELARAGDEVGVDVRLDRVGDPETVLPRRGHVARRCRAAGSTTAASRVRAQAMRYAVWARPSSKKRSNMR